MMERLFKWLAQNTGLSVAGMLVGVLLARFNTIWTWAQERLGDDPASHAEAGKALRDELREDVDSVKNDMADLRQTLEEVREEARKEREARMEAQMQVWVLRRKLDLVISMLNDMREREGLNRISADDLPDVPVKASPPDLSETDFSNTNVSS